MIARLTLETGEDDQFGIFDKKTHQTVKVDCKEGHLGPQLQHELAELIFKVMNTKGSLDESIGD